MGNEPPSDVAAHAAQSDQSNLHPTGLYVKVSRNIALSADHPLSRVPPMLDEQYP
jgi:hypothetical protein